MNWKVYERLGLFPEAGMRDTFGGAWIMKTIRNLMVIAGVMTACAGAHADFFADFESYGSNQKLSGVNGWKGWDNVSSYAGTVSNSVAYESSNSMKVTGIGGATDAVQQFAGATSGVWTVSAMQYLGSGQGGSTYFILMNKYSDGGNSNAQSWSTQLRFDLGSGRVYDDFRGGSVAIAMDEWASIRVDINLTANTVKHYYNDTLISSGSWTRGGASVKALAAIDLYSGDQNAAYYDDIAVESAASMSVSRVPGPGALATAGLAGLLVMPRRRRL